MFAHLVPALTFFPLKRPDMKKALCGLHRPVSSKPDSQTADSQTSVIPGQRQRPKKKKKSFKSRKFHQWTELADIPQEVMRQVIKVGTPAPMALSSNYRNICSLLIVLSVYLFLKKRILWDTEIIQPFGSWQKWLKSCIFSRIISRRSCSYIVKLFTLNSIMLHSG